MAGGEWTISATGSYASGTYYGTYTGTFTGTYFWLENNVDISASGTCWEIHTGTAEIEQVAQILAYEGQWFVKANSQNIMVADIEMMPVRRNSQYQEWGSGYIDIAFEFPMHFRAPATLDGTTELIFDSGATVQCAGMCTFGNYVFTRGYPNGTIYRIDIDTGLVDSWAGTPVPSADPSFSVIDKDHVLVQRGGYIWKMLDFRDYSERDIGTTLQSYNYKPHWAVIKDILCVGIVDERDLYPASPSWTKRWVSNYMINIWTGETIYSERELTKPADAFIENAWFRDLVINKSFFWCVAKTSENGGTWPEVVGPEPAIIYKIMPYENPSSGGGLIQNFTPNVTKKNLFYYGTYGDLEVSDMAYNPEDKLIYIAFVYYTGDWGGSDQSGILVMSPDNLSYNIIYSVPITTSRPPNPEGEVGNFYVAQDKLYVTLSQYYGRYDAPKPDRMYDVRHLTTPLWTLPDTYSIGGSNGGWSRVVDVNNRLWYMGNHNSGDETMLYGINIETGITEISIDTGIDEPWGDQYYYPTDYQYRQLLPHDKSILVLNHNTIQYPYQGRPYIADKNSYIYRVT